MTKLAQVKQSVTAAQLLKLTKRLGCKAKYIDGKVWLVRCGASFLSYPLLDRVFSISLNQI